MRRFDNALFRPSDKWTEVFGIIAPEYPHAWGILVLQTPYPGGGKCCPLLHMGTRFAFNG